jgi:hypothetical protein
MEGLRVRTVGRELVHEREVKNRALVDSIVIFLRHAAFILPERAWDVNLFSKVLERLLECRVALDRKRALLLRRLLLLALAHGPASLRQNGEKPK